MNTHDEKFATIDYLRRTAAATEATAKTCRVIMWLLIVFVAVPMTVFVYSLGPAFMKGYNSEMSRHAPPAIQGR